MTLWLRCLAPKRELTGLSRCLVPTSGQAWLLNKCSALWKAFYCPSEAERPLVTISELEGISWFRVSILA